MARRAIFLCWPNLMFFEVDFLQGRINLIVWGCNLVGGEVIIIIGVIILCWKDIFAVVDMVYYRGNTLIL